jgi:hypothetical protein
LRTWTGSPTRISMATDLTANPGRRALGGNIFHCLTLKLSVREALLCSTESMHYKWKHLKDSLQGLHFHLSDIFISNYSGACDLTAETNFQV